MQFLRAVGFYGCFGLLVAFLTGCASAAPSVRALRMYDREQPTPALLRQHIHEMDAALSLINQMLNGTPYEPGAPWVNRVPLDEATAARVKEAITARAGQASFVGVYVTHLQSVLSDVRNVANGLAPPDVTGAPLAGGLPVPTAARNTYASIVDALAHVHPALGNGAPALERTLTSAINETNSRYAELTSAGSPDRERLAQMERTRADLEAQLARLRADLTRPVSLSDLQDPERRRVVTDAVTVTSTALRLATEAISLATVVALETISLAQQSPKNWLKGIPDTVQLAAELPEDARRVYQHLDASARGLKTLLSQLSNLTGVNALETPGFLLKDGLVDELVGFGWDSIHMQLQGGGEAFYYSAIDAEQSSTDSSGNTYDYTGRQTRLEYDVEPIVLAAARLSLKLDLPHWMEAIGLNLGYATNRVYRSGGDLGTGSLANELGASSTWSDALDAALAVAGFKSKVRLANFTQGTVRDVLIADGSLLAQAPLTFGMKQIDIGYDFAPQRGPLIQTLTVGFRYFDYTLPRILYELVNSTPGASTAAYVFSRETPPQAIRTRYYMLSVATRVEKRVTPHFAPYLGLDFAAGYGPTDYYFLRDPNGDDVESNHDRSSSNSIGLGFAGALGFRWTLGGPEARLKAYFDAYYQAQAIASTLDSKNKGDLIVNVGTTDVFHGPVASFGATF